MCDKIEKLPSLCKICCNGTNAIFSHRTSKNLCQKLIGGQDEYLPLCRACYLENNLIIQIPYNTYSYSNKDTNAPKANETHEIIS